MEVQCEGGFCSATCRICASRGVITTTIRAEALVTSFVVSSDQIRSHCFAPVASLCHYKHYNKKVQINFPCVLYPQGHTK